MALFQELLVDAHNRHDDALLVLDISADFLDHIVEAMRMDIESPLQALNLLLGQPLLDQALVVEAVTKGGSQVVGNFLELADTWELFILLIC